MAIRDDIGERLKQARRDRDSKTLNVIGMLKNKLLLELKSGKGKEEDDALWKQVIGAYAKQLRKAIPELEKAGDRGAEQVAESQFELEFCERYLPQALDESGTEALIRKLAAEHSIDNPKMLGKLMGLLMKNHRDEIDGGLAKQVAARVLSES